jgi:hypothetical protein
MSSTIKAQVLSKAIELWKNPENRLEGKLYNAVGGHCALGVLSQAEHLVTGKPTIFRSLHSACKDWDRVAGYIGYSEAWKLADFNNKSVANRSKLYRLMQEELAKELA